MWPDVTGHDQVVEAGDRDVTRCAQAQGGENAEGADGHLVVCTHDRLGRLPVGEQFADGVGTARLGEMTDRVWALGDRQPRRAHRLAVTRERSVESGERGGPET